MKKLLTEWREYLNEMKLDILEAGRVGDVLLGGNIQEQKPNLSLVKEIGKDEGRATYCDHTTAMPLLANLPRIEKHVA